MIVLAKDARAWLAKRGSQHTIDEMARYGIEAKRAFGVPMGTLLKYSKWVGIDQELSLALWKSGWYEARLLASLVGDAEQVTAKQMDTWAASFENWGDCDTVCFKLFDRSPAGTTTAETLACRSEDMGPHTLNLNSMTSPSATTYSRPSWRTSPFSRA